MSGNSAEYNRNYYLRNKGERRDKHNLSSKRYYQEHREEIRRKKKVPLELREIPEERSIIVKRYALKLKVEALTYYGGGELTCIRCGFSDVRALSIDHIDSNGSAHRKIIGHSPIYRWLKKNNYPEGYQTLCMNCQFIKGSGGGLTKPEFCGRV